MFAPSPKSSASRRNKPYARKAQAMSRSGSILGTIRNIVSAPLSWWASNEEFEDLGKRRRVDARDVSGDESENEGRSRQKAKRIRLDSPERAQQPVAGYLDPPSSSFRSAQEGARWNDLGRTKPSGNAYTRRTATYSAMPLSDSRTMSVDPPSQYTKLRRDRPMGSLSLAPPIKTSHSMSLGPLDSSVRPPPSPFKLRTSLTPQPSIAKPIRREASAPPPLSSLQSRPIFVKPPPEETSARQLSAQKTLSLGALAEFSRVGRSSSQDQMLTSFGSLSSVPSQSSTSISSNATLQTMQSTAEKTFHKLEMYKTPIVPSRYKDAKVIPDFLKPKRVHVPIPMPKKGRELKPSLGMAKNKSGIKDGHGENNEQTRGSGKPYAGKGGLSKLLARRKAEAEEESGRKTFGLVDEEMDEGEGQGVRSGKRDVGVSARLTSGSEDERAQKRRNANIEASAPQSSDPFAKSPVSLTHGGRSQPYGRVGRTRVRDPGLRSVPLGRTANTNKFSAAFDEEEGAGGEDLAMDTADDANDNVEKVASSAKEKEAGTAPAFVAPKGFTFANNETAIQHDHAGAKEPPIPSLPFSFGKPAAASTDATPKAAEIPSFFKPPASSSTSVVQHIPETDTTNAQTSTAVPPKVSVLPPTPKVSAPAPARQETSVPPNFFATPPAPSSTTGTVPPSSGIPNFFAQSAAFKDSAPSSLPSTIPSTSSPFGQSMSAASVPVKDPENPLWSKNGSSVSTPGAPITTKPAVPKPLFGDAGKPFSFGAKPAENADAKIATPSPLSASPFGTMPKQAESSAENRPASAPLFGGAQAAAASPASSNLMPPVTGISTQPAGPSPFTSSAQATTSKPAEPEGKASGLAPSPFFAFGANGGSTPKPLFGTGSTSSPATPFQTAAGQPAVSASTNTQQSSPFTFGAPPIARTSSNTATASVDVAPVAPKPLFGGTTGGTGFSFGAPAVPVSSASGVDAAKSPFAFGAPPATPPSGAERKETSFPFGTSAPSSSSGTTFTFGTPAKTNENAPAASPFTFGARPAQPATPPSKADEGMNMEESPIRMDMNGGNGQNKPTGGITFGLGATPVNPFGQPGGGASSMFPFGGPAANSSPASNPFGAKEENKLAAPSSGGFNFNRTASAPAISTTFSFGQKSEGPTPPATAFGAPTNPFGQVPPSSGGNAAPFSFGQQSAPPSNPFGAPSQQQQPSMAVETVGSSAPSSPFTSAPSFSFGTSSAGTGNPFGFGASQPSSPAGAATGLPQSPATGNTGTPSFTFGQSSGASGSTLFNIGAPPPSNPPGGTPGRQMKKLPRRGPAKR